MWIRIGLVIICLFQMRSYGSEQALVDRLVLEINKISYTQRQFEIYFALKSALSADSAQVLEYVNTQNWQKLLDQYKNFMLIEQEALRLSSLQPSTEIIESGLKAIEARRQSDASFAGFLTRERLDGPEIRQFLSSIARIDAYIQGKQGADEKGYLGSPWFQTLQQRVPYRIYIDAKNFVPSHPENLAGGKLQDLKL